jgi:uncharacterized protein involved in exopolysaccharide biosynthesis
LIAVPVVIGTIGGFVASWRTPPRYRSQAVIMVVPSRVTSGYVQPVAPRSLEDRIATMQQIILSRTRLERLVTDYKLLEAEQKTMIMEEVIELVRKNIQVRTDGPGRAGDTFTVAYTGSEPLTTMKITEKLAAFFIDESMRDGERNAEGTTAFLESQAEQVGARLTAAVAANRGVSERARIEIDVLRATYTKLLTNLEDARMRNNLENRQIGERFVLIDQARLPEQPTNRTRAQAAGVGALAGLALGVVLALFAGTSRSLSDRRRIRDRATAEEI